MNPAYLLPLLLAALCHLAATSLHASGNQYPDNMKELRNIIASAAPTPLGQQMDSRLVFDSIVQDKGISEISDSLKFYMIGNARFGNSRLFLIRMLSYGPDLVGSDCSTFENKIYLGMLNGKDIFPPLLPVAAWTRDYDIPDRIYSREKILSFMKTRQYIAARMISDNEIIIVYPESSMDHQSSFLEYITFEITPDGFVEKENTAYYFGTDPNSIVKLPEKGTNKVWKNLHKALKRVDTPTESHFNLKCNDLTGCIELDRTTVATQLLQQQFLNPEYGSPRYFLTGKKRINGKDYYTLEAVHDIDKERGKYNFDVYMFCFPDKSDRYPQMLHIVECRESYSLRGLSMDYFLEGDKITITTSAIRHNQFLIIQKFRLSDHGFIPLGTNSNDYDIREVLDFDPYGNSGMRIGNMMQVLNDAVVQTPDTPNYMTQWNYSIGDDLKTERFSMPVLVRSDFISREEYLFDRKAASKGMFPRMLKIRDID